MTQAIYLLFFEPYVMDQAPISQNKYMSKLTLIHYHLKIILSNVTKLLLINNCPTLLLNHCIWLCLTLYEFQVFEALNTFYTKCSQGITISSCSL